MNWKTWLVHYSPKDWTISDKLQYIQVDCPNVTLEDVLGALN